MVHDDGDVEDLEEHEAKQARLDFLREIDRIKETIVPGVVEAAEDGKKTNVCGRVAHRRKRSKLEHVVAGSASVKRSMTGGIGGDDGQATDGITAPTADCEQDSPRELVQLQAKVMIVLSTWLAVRRCLSGYVSSHIRRAGRTTP